MGVARRRRLVVLVAALAALLALAGCGVTRGDDGGENRRLRMMIPNSPGGGYDQTGRAATRVMESADLTGRFEVSNVIGASGTVAMQRLVNERGAEDLLMTMGLGVVGATYTNGSDARVSGATPIAQLIEEQEGLLVPADSPFETVADLVEAWRADPGSIRVGGGSSPGGPDHLFPMQLAQTVGVDPTEVNYIVYDGGGPLTTALLGAKIDVGTSGLGEFEGQLADGSLRVLAVSGEERLDAVDAPTLVESGIDLVFTNWRGVLAPPGISDAVRDQHVALLEEMHGTDAWQEALETNGWVDAFRTGDDFAEFLREQDERVASTLDELGLL
ncbi:Bug family tripartite tricarboxylate transporter substrate binding protein [Cellulomonas cellasea]|uniref:C4-dicarboxylate ABC transporter substrate-binding protein n=2 Tax=Cellulomonas cellasea TaxID=43670 RepID=A0A0A0BER6_9CELL|nr:tripartite tricarboxylate transporter substrate-binding protein [Cellulomonas cellasea]KGM03826.1 C4-dicarboxylate ABC transporter substrate-binding protein [Cellulomonas cellasea DSM 20118]GEA87236.1 C4-dicarboxylate ABC transporter substrate-binding protein [Cellulomonas cellasea]